MEACEPQENGSADLAIIERHRAIHTNDRASTRREAAGGKSRVLDRGDAQTLFSLLRKAPRGNGEQCLVRLAALLS